MSKRKVVRNEYKNYLHKTLTYEKNTYSKFR
jgi:hypothetical protein